MIHPVFARSFSYHVRISVMYTHMWYIHICTKNENQYSSALFTIKGVIKTWQHAVFTCYNFLCTKPLVILPVKENITALTSEENVCTLKVGSKPSIIIEYSRLNYSLRKKWYPVCAVISKPHFFSEFSNYFIKYQSWVNK